MTREQVQRIVAENYDFCCAEYNAAFVEMEYFRDLRRDQHAAGFNFWLN